ncbi:hypothetical protein ACFRMN_15875 [Streptomyces sp. NPDC056835]|uniref:hypothetical protein n=1 Tax=Streptomyces sp. NPDC056835 TaxID=3345956 RepID=UPI00368C80E2
MSVSLALVVVLVVPLACGGVAYLTYRHPTLEAPLTIALTTLTALAAVMAAAAAVIALLRR